jgi:hypothetical protein
MASEGVTFHLSVRVEGDEKEREQRSRVFEAWLEILEALQGIDLIKTTKSPYKLSDIRDTPPRKG